MFNKKDKKSMEVIVKVFNDKRTPFSKFNTRTKISKRFNKDNIKVIRKGKELNVYDWTQSGREGTEIKEVLKKYNGDAKLTQEMMYAKWNEIGDMLTGINDLHDYMQAKIKAENYWKSLPLEIREQFNNNVYEFCKNGRKWAQDKINEFEAKNKVVVDTSTVETTTTQGTNE